MRTKQDDFFWYIEYGHRHMVLELLAKHGADLDLSVKDDHNHTPLQAAANFRKWNILNDIVSNPPSKNSIHHSVKKDVEGYGFAIIKAIGCGENHTAYFVMEKARYLEHSVFESLLRFNFDEFYAPDRKFIELVLKNTDFTQRLAKKKGALIQLVEREQYDTFLQLAERILIACPPDVIDPCGLDAALLIVAQKDLTRRHYHPSHTHFVKKLINLGANPTSPHARDPFGNTALHILFSKNLADPFCVSNISWHYNVVQFFDQFCYSPKLNIKCINSSLQTARDLNPELYTKVEQRANIIRLSLVMSCLHVLKMQSLDGYPDSHIGTLPWELIHYIAEMAWISTGISLPFEKEKLNIFVCQDTVRQERIKKMIEYIAWEERCCGVFSKRLTQKGKDFLQNLKNAKTSLNIREIVHNFFDPYFSNNRHNETEIWYLQQRVIDFQIVYSSYWEPMERLRKTDLEKTSHAKNFLTRFENTLSIGEKIMHPSKKISDFIKKLTPMNNAKNITSCVNEFMELVFFSNQHNEKKDILLLLEETQLTTKDFLESLRIKYEPDVLARNRALHFINICRKSIEYSPGYFNNLFNREEIHVFLDKLAKTSTANQIYTDCHLFVENFINATSKKKMLRL